MLLSAVALSRNLRRTRWILIVVFALAFGSIARGATFRIDPEHSSVLLSTTHLGIGTVQGLFESFAGSFTYDPADLGASTVSFTIDASSIDTRQELRDKHLRSPEFLDVEKYPAIRFESTRVTAEGPDGLQILGQLTLHGVTKEISLPVTFRGTATDLDGHTRVALSSTTQINRRDYGLLWDRTVGNAALVGQVVRIYLEVEGVEQTPASVAPGTP